MLTAAYIATWAVLSSSRNEGKTVAWAVIGAGIGVYLFYRGFRMLQFKRLILNTPLSKVRSASMGLVELSGMAVGPGTIPAGITGDPCYYYRATAWELQRSGNNREWKQVANESLFVPFFVQDDTGRMLVNAQGAEMDVHRNFKDEFGGSFFSAGDMPLGPAEDFLLRYGISGRHVRVEEYCIKPKYPLFVLGTLGENHARARSVPEKHVSSPSSWMNVRRVSRPAVSGLWGTFGGISSTQAPLNMHPAPSLGRSTAGPRAAQPAARASQLPQVASRSMAPVAASAAWSDISMDEVHPPVAAAKIAASTSVAQMERPSGQEIRAAREPFTDRATERATNQEMAQASRSPLHSAPPAVLPRPNMLLPDTPPLGISPESGFDLNAAVAIGQGDSGAPFTISSESQRDLVRALGWKSTACIWGGPALTVTCVYILLLTLGLL
jgi:hypothetical protein